MVAMVEAHFSEYQGEWHLIEAGNKQTKLHQKSLCVQGGKSSSSQILISFQYVRL